MIIGLLGQMGVGKSTVATMLAARTGFRLFDMDNECPEEFRQRNSRGEVVPASDVKEYQRGMVDRLITLAGRHNVVMAGFFLDIEFPKLIESRVTAIWINLVTDDRVLLENRLVSRQGHFATAAALSILETNWPLRREHEYGLVRIDCGMPVEKVVQECLSFFP